jgi:hypothetical protein
MTTDGQVARMESKSKWFLYGVDLSVPVKEFPILSFRYKVEEGDPPWTWRLDMGHLGRCKGKRV